MLTFDDGYLDNWLRAWPVLKEYNLHAHIFLITGLIGKGNVRSRQEQEYSHRDCERLIADNRSDEVMLRWSEVREMRDSDWLNFMCTPIHINAGTGCLYHVLNSAGS